MGRITWLDMVYYGYNKEILPSCDCEALDEYFHDDQMELDSPSVLDAIVSYEGGIATGYEVRRLVDRVYGINLWRV